MMLLTVVFTVILYGILAETGMYHHCLLQYVK